ncbi:drebrin isoform X6 [Corythoichthys intestinalis]|uniref:drebrin isoform X6 n=1 Tax=Corythoichthys intestinalis TaxID=161448 RepID=UPI0025A5B8B3|nr:drebrin isoform X6 [Corythoichthys intestinalis]
MASSSSPSSSFSSSSSSSSSSLIPRLSSISSGLDAPLSSNMAVNLAKNRLLLLTAYQDVIDECSDTDWALYTYEDDSNDLTLASTGGGGLAEITLTFDNARVMYGFCGLKEPNAALPRYILINWVGDDVPDARKCACASHVATIADFFQGVAVIINASSVDDIDPSAIGQRLTNGTAVAASPVLTRLKTREEERGDVKGTVYQKTNAEVEMKKINREEFWEQAKREEELRKEEERKKLAEERQRFEEERMELERKEQENRERRYRERERQIEEHRKKIQEEEEAKDRLQSHTTLPAELSIDDLSLDKKESEVEVQEAKAIIAQRSGNPREFFKQKERAMTISVDTSPVAVHRAGRLDSPFLRQQHSPGSPTWTPPPRGVSPLRTAAPHAQTHRAAGDNGEQASVERNVAAVSPIPQIVTTPIKEEANMETECAFDWEPKQEQKAPVQEWSPSKPVQSVAPQAREPAFSTWDSATEDLVDLMGDAPTAGVRSQPLLSFDELTDGDSRAATEGDRPAGPLDEDASEQMTLSYQHALQHAAADGHALMTNGETLIKEAAQASEGYFSQSQEEEFGQLEEGSAKATPVLYNKPPEIDITCWDADPVADDDDD